MSREEQGIDVFAMLDDPGVDPGFVDHDVKTTVVAHTPLPAKPVPVVPASDSPKDEAPPRSGYGHHNNSRRGTRW